MRRPSDGCEPDPDRRRHGARAPALVETLWDSETPADVARLRAQALLIAAYEESRWPPRPPSPAELIHHLMDQHGLSRADMVPYLGTPIA